MIYYINLAMLIIASLQFIFIASGLLNYNTKESLMDRLCVSILTVMFVFITLHNLFSQ